MMHKTECLIVLEKDMQSRDEPAGSNIWNIL